MEVNAFTVGSAVRCFRFRTSCYPISRYIKEGKNIFLVITVLWFEFELRALIFKMSRVKSIINLCKKSQLLRVNNRKCNKALHILTNHNFKNDQKSQFSIKVPQVFPVGLMCLILLQSDEDKKNEKQFFQAAQFGDLQVIQK